MNNVYIAAKKLVVYSISHTYYEACIKFNVPVLNGLQQTYTSSSDITTLALQIVKNTFKKAYIAEDVDYSKCVLKGIRGEEFTPSSSDVTGQERICYNAGKAWVLGKAHELVRACDPEIIEALSALI